MVCNSYIGVASPLAKPASTQSQRRVGLELASRRLRNGRTAPRRPRLDTSQSTSMIVSYTPARRGLLLRYILLVNLLSIPFFDITYVFVDTGTFNIRLIIPHQ